MAMVLSIVAQMQNTIITRAKMVEDDHLLFVLEDMTVSITFIKIELYLDADLFEHFSN